MDDPRLEIDKVIEYLNKVKQTITDENSNRFKVNVTLPWRHLKLPLALNDSCVLEIRVKDHTIFEITDTHA